MWLRLVKSYEPVKPWRIAECRGRGSWDREPRKVSHSLSEGRTPTSGQEQLELLGWNSVWRRKVLKIWTSTEAGARPRATERSRHNLYTQIEAESLIAQSLPRMKVNDSCIPGCPLDRYQTKVSFGEGRSEQERVTRVARGSHLLFQSCWKSCSPRPSTSWGQARAVSSQLVVICNLIWLYELGQIDTLSRI